MEDIKKETKEWELLKTNLVRVGTLYVPVHNVGDSAKWYQQKLGASINYEDDDKAILDLADVSLFLVEAMEHQSANFQDKHGENRFSITFEVDGEEALSALRRELLDRGVEVGGIEDRGHPGRNFIFKDPDGNMFDVWSKLAPSE